VSTTIILPDKTCATLTGRQWDCANPVALAFLIAFTRLLKPEFDERQCAVRVARRFKGRMLPKP
jgi:hypothetical protein